MSVVQTLELDIPHSGVTFDVRGTVEELFLAADRRTHDVMTAIAGMSIADSSEIRQLEAGSKPVTEWAAGVLADHMKP